MDFVVGIEDLLFLRKTKRLYWELVESQRSGGTVKTKVVVYLGRLTEFDVMKIKYAISIGDKSILAQLIEVETKKQSQEIKWSAADKVTYAEVRPNVFKKTLDLDWLRTRFTEGWTISKIAASCGVGKERVRQDLDELGIDQSQRTSSTRQRAVHQEFGYKIVDGKKVKNPVEYEIIQQMFSWREQGLSFQGIADKLTGIGAVGKLGVSNWDRGAVRRIILRNQGKEKK